MGREVINPKYLTHSQEREIINSYWKERGIKRTWLGCCDCSTEYCVSSTCHGIYSKLKIDSSGTEDTDVLS